MINKKKYDITTKGFLPKHCSKIPNEFKYLENLYNEKDTDLVFRNLVKDYQLDYKLEDININKYDIGQLKTLYTISGMLSHVYIWCDEHNPCNSLPYILAFPLWHSSNILGIKPVLTHAAVDLWNWKLIDENKKFNLDNIESKYLMTIDLSHKKTESWFYLIMTAIEGECGKIIYNMDKIYCELENNSPDENIIYINLQCIDQILDKQINIINRIYDHCNPDIFYHKLRIFLNGSEKLSNGLILEGLNVDPISFKGGSAAQSSIIPAEDIFFQVKHTQKDIIDFLKEMRGYMPEKHRELLKYFNERPKLEDFLQNFKNQNIKILYNGCINKLKKFRNCHMTIVKKYIFKPQGNINGTGTGGTPLESFLQTIIKNTEIQFNKTLIYNNYNLYYINIIICILTIVIFYLYKYIIYE